MIYTELDDVGQVRFRVGNQVNAKKGSSFTRSEELRTGQRYLGDIDRSSWNSRDLVVVTLSDFAIMLDLMQAAVLGNCATVHENAKCIRLTTSFWYGQPQRDQHTLPRPKSRYIIRT